MPVPAQLDPASGPDHKRHVTEYGGILLKQLVNERLIADKPAGEALLQGSCLIGVSFGDIVVILLVR